MSARFLDRPIETLCVSPQATLEQTARVVQNGAKQIALVVDEARRLLGTVTDGDLRRAMLAGVAMDTPAERVMHCAFVSGHPSMDVAQVMALMRQHSVRHLPLLSAQRIVVDLAWITDLINNEMGEISAVVMAGGLGTRLRPLTNETPKPMLPVGGRPMMERLIRQLGAAGINRVRVTTHYRSECIEEHFGNGEAFGVQIEYVNEERPLGTAGALGLLEPALEPVLVLNGDIVTNVDLRAMHTFHREQRAALTMAVRLYDVQIPFGVVECRGTDVLGLREKPTYQHMVNAGIYLLQPEAIAHVPRHERSDMTDLIGKLIARGERVVCFPVVEYWLDVGRPGDYQRVQLELE